MHALGKRGHCAYVHEHQALEVFVGFGQKAAVRTVDSGMPVVALGCLDFDTRGCILGNTLL